MKHGIIEQQEEFPKLLRHKHEGHIIFAEGIYYSKEYTYGGHLIGGSEKLICSYCEMNYGQQSDMWPNPYQETLYGTEFEYVEEAHIDLSDAKPLNGYYPRLIEFEGSIIIVSRPHNNHRPGVIWNYRMITIGGDLNWEDKFACREASFITALLEGNDIKSYTISMKDLHK